MFIKVKVYPRAKKAEINQDSEDSFVVKLKAKPERGAANRELVRLLASYLNIPDSNIRLVKGARQRNKIFEIKDPV